MLVLRGYMLMVAWLDVSVKSLTLTSSQATFNI
jgi:hypothetical protein